MRLHNQAVKGLRKIILWRSVRSMATYKNGSKHLPPELLKRNLRIVRLAKAGETPSQIARTLGMTRQRVHQILQREMA